jgi:adenine deaminase
MEEMYSGHIVDIRKRKIFPGKICVRDGSIENIVECTEFEVEKSFLLPGFIDAHIHIESSMLVPSEFARWAIPHGTVATVSDPHEIANVLGAEGIDFMIDNGAKVPLKFFFGAPSCVPATGFETAGASIQSDDIRKLLKRSDISYLAEMMNWPGVLAEDEEVMKKIRYAHEAGKLVDGHAPGLRGEKAKSYFAQGISTDHECTQLEEAVEKIEAGAKIAIREGSAAKNFEALHPLFVKHAQSLMFCSDDKHPDELMDGHINLLVRRALEKGYSLFDVLHAACVHPVDHYGLGVGTLQVGDSADFIRVKDLRDFDILESTIDGSRVYGGNGVNFEPRTTTVPNVMKTKFLKAKDLALPADGDRIRLIVAEDGELATKKEIVNCRKNNRGEAISAPDRDICKIVVYNRYLHAAPAIAFIRGFGLQSGALASSVAHDCHNIIAVGVSDADICKAINSIIEHKGGISFMDGAKEDILPLPVAGLMTTESGDKVARSYERLTKLVKNNGSALSAPYMTLSFMALLVIPSLKLSDRGLFDGENFEFVALFTDS